MLFITNEQLTKLKITLSSFVAITSNLEKTPINEIDNIRCKIIISMVKYIEKLAFEFYKNSNLSNDEKLKLYFQRYKTEDDMLLKMFHFISRIIGKQLIKYDWNNVYENDLNHIFSNGNIYGNQNDEILNALKVILKKN